MTVRSCCPEESCKNGSTGKISRSSHLQISFKIGVLKNFTLITGKHLCWSLFLIKLTPEQVFSCEYFQKILKFFSQNTSGGCFWKIWVYSIDLHARFTQELLKLPFTFFDWKTFKSASNWKSATTILHFFLRKVSETYYLLFLTLFLFLSTFSVFHNDYFFKCLAYKSLPNRFSDLINYILWPYNFFFCIQLFPRFFMVQVFLGPSFLRSRFFRVQVKGLGPDLRSSPT